MKTSLLENILEQRVNALHLKGTRVSAKSRHCLLARRLRVQVPSFVGFSIGLTASLDGDIFLTSYCLAIKDEEGNNVVALPLIKVLIDVGVDARKAPEG